MNPRRAMAIALWLAGTGMGVSSLYVLSFGRIHERILAGQDVSPDALVAEIAAVWGLCTVAFAYATSGLVLASRSGTARFAWILLLAGVVFEAVPFGYIVGGSIVLDDPYGPLGNAIFLLGPSMLPPAYALILPALALAFPYGDLPSRRWRWPTFLAAATLAAATLVRLVAPGEIAGAASSRNPFGWGNMPAGLRAVADAAMAVGLLAISVLGVAAVVVRYRRANAIERQQLRWFAAAVLVAVVPTVMSALSSGLAGPLWALGAMVGLLLVPVSVGIAITRYRLYDIDRIISRGVSWGLLTATLVGVYAGVVLVLQGALAGITQGGTLAVAASTLAAAALFQPLRQRIQRATDRRFDRGRYDAEQTLSDFSVRLRDEVDLANVEAEVGRTVSAVLRPQSAGLWIRRPGS